MYILASPLLVQSKKEPPTETSAVLILFVLGGRGERESICASLQCHSVGICAIVQVRVRHQPQESKAAAQRWVAPSLGVHVHCVPTIARGDDVFACVAEERRPVPIGSLPKGLACAVCAVHQCSPGQVVVRFIWMVGFALNSIPAGENVAAIVRRLNAVAFDVKVREAVKALVEQPKRRGIDGSCESFVGHGWDTF